MRKVTCKSCEGVGNHGKDKRGKTLTCKECNGVGKTDPSTEDWSAEYPDINFCDIEYLSGDDSDIEALVQSSDTHIICIVTNRDGDVVSTHKLEAHMDDVNDLLEETSEYSGDWGDYHIVQTIIYQRKSYYAAIEKGRQEGNGDIDISTVLPKASLTLNEVRTLLVDSLEGSDSMLREVIVDIIARTRETKAV